LTYISKWKWRRIKNETEDKRDDFNFPIVS
jgi:hypothetical protein